MIFLRRHAFSQFRQKRIVVRFRRRMRVQDPASTSATAACRNSFRPFVGHDETAARARRRNRHEGEGTCDSWSW
jgi:hypothetical protein